MDSYCVITHYQIGLAPQNRGWQRLLISLTMRVFHLMTKQSRCFLTSMIRSKLLFFHKLVNCCTLWQVSLLQSHAAVMKCMEPVPSAAANLVLAFHSVNQQQPLILLPEKMQFVFAAAAAAKKTWLLSPAPPVPACSMSGCCSEGCLCIFSSLASAGSYSS